MVLVDTSVWVDHLRSKEGHLVRLLESGQVCIHPMIMGELACGHLQNRKQLLSLFGNLPQVTQATHEEVFHCIERNKLMGKGAGFVDLHLLTSSLISPDAVLWTRDRSLRMLAELLGVCWSFASH